MDTDAVDKAVDNKEDKPNYVGSLELHGAILQLIESQRDVGRDEIHALYELFTSQSPPAPFLETHNWEEKERKLFSIAIKRGQHNTVVYFVKVGSVTGLANHL